MGLSETDQQFGEGVAHLVMLAFPNMLNCPVSRKPRSLGECTNGTSTQMSVSGLMDYFAKGRIAVPEIQRDVVWSSDQVKELLDSISREYPCGSLILWEPRLSDKKLVKEIIRPERLEFYKGVLPKYFVIDGQQRLTALASVMLQRDFLRKLELEISEDIFSLYVNLRNFPKDIQAASDGEAYKFPWCFLNEVFGAGIKESPDYDRLSKDVKKKIDQYIQRIRDYQFPVQIIQESNYPTVGKIFARVNSQGTQLTGRKSISQALFLIGKEYQRNFVGTEETCERVATISISPS
jgi:hypothetical protein